MTQLNQGLHCGFLARILMFRAFPKPAIRSFFHFLVRNELRAVTVHYEQASQETGRAAISKRFARLCQGPGHGPRFNRTQRKVCGLHFNLVLMRLNSFESFRIADL